MLDEKIIGLKLQELRTRLELGREKFSEKPDLSTRYIEYLEENVNTPTIGTICKIANAYNVPSDTLLNVDLPEPVVINLNSITEKLQDLDACNLFYIKAVVDTVLTYRPTKKAEG